MLKRNNYDGKRRNNYSFLYKCDNKSVENIIV